MNSDDSTYKSPWRRSNSWRDDWDDEPVLEKPKRRTEVQPKSTRQMPTQPTRLAAPSRPASPTPPPAASNGNFTIHTVEELHEGSEIVHQRFGHGTVMSIDTSGSDAKIDVAFNDGQTRKLLLKFAKFEIL